MEKGYQVIQSYVNELSAELLACNLPNNTTIEKIISTQNEDLKVILNRKLLEAVINGGNIHLQ